jgi:O-acetyl-ADP-ribose deacetylase (regulator of RNase III)
MECTVIQGDIAQQSADCLVNAAGTSLRMGSGVAGALRRKAGEALNEDAIEKGPIELGEVLVTSAYDLDAEYVIHAAAMPHYGDGRARETSIRDATRNSLETADDLGCESVVIPALGCGVAGFELEDGARIIAEEILQYEPDSLSTVEFIGYSQAESETISRVVEMVRSETT